MVAKSQQLIDLPPVAQRKPHDCGPAVARSILTHFVKPLVRVDATLRACPKDGTPPGRLAALFVGAGLGVVMRSGMSVGHLADLAVLGVPVLCPVQSGGEGHWVAVRGVSGGMVRLMDPAEGQVSVPVGKFEERWHDTLSDGTAVERFGLAVFGY